MSNVFSFTFFSLPLIFTLHWWTLAFLILSPPLQSFHVVLPTKKCLLCFSSLWASLACRLLSLFLCLSLALYSKFVDMTINLLSLIPYTPRIQKQSPLSVFVFIDSLVVSVSPVFMAKITLVAIPVDWVILYIGMPVVRMDGRPVARCTVTWLPNCLGWVDLLSHGAPL